MSFFFLADIMGWKRSSDRILFFRRYFLDSLINFCNGAGHKTGSLIHCCCVFLSTDTLALPKLNLQFLTLHDYLLRNLNLFRLESTCKENRFYSELYNSFGSILLKQMTVEKRIPRQLHRPITTGANSAMKQSEFLEFWNLLKARRKKNARTRCGYFWFCMPLVEKLARGF